MLNQQQNITRYCNARGGSVYTKPDSGVQNYIPGILSRDQAQIPKASAVSRRLESQNGDIMNFMNLPESRRWRGVFLALLIAVAMAGTAQGSVRIGGFSLSANGQLAQGFQYTGSCPVNLKFDFGVIGTEPTAITYSFTRNDGGSGGARTTNLPRANQSVPVFDNWRLGANTPQFSNYRGWVEINITSPNPVSRKINFTLHCR